jgi:predicted phage terminase large subunit-like protein
MKLGDVAGFRESIKRKGLLEFMRVFWDEIESVGFSEEPHIELICKHLEACALRGTESLKPDLEGHRWAERCPAWIQDLVIAVPPGMTKSKTVSVFFPAWVWTWCPGARFITTSYADDLAIDFGRQSFDLMTCEGFRAMYPDLEIEGGERAAMSDYRNTAKGRRWSMPMGGKVTGKHGHFLLSDDPTKPDDLKLGGDSAREALNQVKYRWDNLFNNRHTDPRTFTRIVIAQRLHTEDLSGHFVKQGAVHLKLPMFFETASPYTSEWGSDWRTEEGELLAPKRFPRDVMDSRKKVTTARDWAAQYQQRPSPEDGSTFQRVWFQNQYTGLPWGQAPITLSVDCSLKDTKKADYTVIQAWAKVGPNHYLIDQVRARMGFSDQVIAIKTMRMKWANVRNIIIEDKANGTAVIDKLKKTISGVIAIDPAGGKEARASASEWLWMSGCVFLPAGAPWLEEYIEEHILFPVGSNDDCVDCTSQYLNWAGSKDKAGLFKKAMAVQRQKMNALAWGNRF